MLGRFEVQEELPRSEVFGAQALEKCGVARAVETIQAESSSNAASELSAHQIGSPAGAEVTQSSAESKSTSDREQNNRMGRPRGNPRDKSKAKLEAA